MAELESPSGINENSPAMALEALRAEHRRLDEEIGALTAQPSLDQVHLARLKRQKLRLKDEIQALMDDSVPDIIA